MKKTIKQIIIPALVLGVMTACEKSELTSYEQPGMVYIYKDYFNNNKDSITYSFAIKSNTLMADTVKVPIRIMGVAASADRIVSVRAIADSSTAVAGQHYEFLPTMVKAGEYTSYIPILVKRTPDIKTSEKRLMIEVIESTDFKVGVPNTPPLNPRAGGSLRFLVKMNDFLSKPSNWDSQIVFSFGTFSQVKFKFIIDVTGRNEFILSGTGDIVSSSQMLFYKTLCKTALANYEAANGPMLDETGTKITFPN